MKTIIVPTDFSPVSINALNYAADMALAVNASLILLHVYQMPVSSNNTDIPLPMMDYRELEEIQQKRIEEFKTRMINEKSAALTIATLVRMGSLVDELKTLSAEKKPFAIVMGTKGAGFVQRLLVGSSTLSVLRNITFPVLVVPPDASFRSIRHIGFACDFQKIQETTPVSLIKEWVATFQADLRVLNVDSNKANVRDTAKQSVLLYTLLQDLHPQYSYIDSPEVEAGISSFAEDNQIDLLIVIPRKHRLLETLFQKSHTKDLIFHSRIPILSVHEEE
ncbi:MAG: universal stress protein [Chitinophagaceae bacterium]|nr:universal stress protein [Chitinophagaceae bacterium]